PRSSRLARRARNRGRPRTRAAARARGRPRRGAGRAGPARSGTVAPRRAGRAVRQRAPPLPGAGCSAAGGTRGPQPAAGRDRRGEGFRGGLGGGHPFLAEHGAVHGGGSGARGSRSTDLPARRRPARRPRRAAALRARVLASAGNGAVIELVDLIRLVRAVLSRRAALEEGIARGYAQALGRLPPRPGPEIAAELPSGMLEALTVAGLLRDDAVDRHYLELMPAQLAAQLRGRGPEERLFAARLDLRRLPRLREGLERLFALVA